MWNAAAARHAGGEADEARVLEPDRVLRDGVVLDHIPVVAPFGAVPKTKSSAPRPPVRVVGDRPPLSGRAADRPERADVRCLKRAASERR